MQRSLVGSRDTTHYAIIPFLGYPSNWEMRPYREMLVI